jgi:hypothetical protein
MHRELEDFRKEKRLLIASRDKRLASISSKYYNRKGYRTEYSLSINDLLLKVANFNPQVILLSIDIQNHIKINQIIENKKLISKDCNVLLFARDEDSEIIKEAWRSGAFFFLRQGARAAEIIPEIERAFEDYFARVQIRYLRNFVFVLMPFKDSFEDVYQFGIKQAVEECNLFCERVDEQHFTEKIIDVVFNNIKRARFVIADMTGRNPNVFYEAGYAEALGKPIIYITQDPSSEIPFDLNQKPHLIYEGKINLLKNYLKERLVGLIEKKVGLS